MTGWMLDPVSRGCRWAAGALLAGLLSGLAAMHSFLPHHTGGGQPPPRAFSVAAPAAAVAASGHTVPRAGPAPAEQTRPMDQPTHQPGPLKVCVAVLLTVVLALLVAWGGRRRPGWARRRCPPLVRPAGRVRVPTSPSLAQLSVLRC